jgi:hypothetical protein
VSVPRRPPAVLSVYRSRRDDTGRLPTWSCGSRGDAFDFAHIRLDYPIARPSLRALATEYQYRGPSTISLPIICSIAAAQFYANRLTAPVVR